jgi:hypothetical protein
VQSVIRVGAAGELFPAAVQIAAGVLLAVLVVAALVKKVRGTGRAKECNTCHL